MAYNFEYPYTDPYRANTDWEINTIKKYDDVIESFIKKFTDEFQETLSGFIDKINKSVVTPQMYGAVGDGIHDDTVAFKNAIKSNKNLYVPCGKYKLTDRLIISGSFGLFGSGKEVSILEWSGNNAGIVCELDNISTNESGCLTIANITLNYVGSNTNTAIKVDGTKTINDRFTQRPMLYNVGFGYGNGYLYSDGWTNGIELFNCNSSYINACNISGVLDNSKGGIGIWIHSNTTPHGTEFFITENKISNFAFGIQSETSEGLTIKGGVIFADVGIFINDSAPYPHLYIGGLHINAATRCIRINGAKEIFILGNELYLSTTVTGNCAIELTENSSSAIIANNFIQNQSNDSYNMMILSGAYITVTNNWSYGNNNQAVAVWITANGNNIEVYKNRFSNTLGTLDQGTNNSILDVANAIPITNTGIALSGYIRYSPATRKLYIHDGTSEVSFSAD